MLWAPSFHLHPCTHPTVTQIPPTKPLWAPPRTKRKVHTGVESTWHVLGLLVRPSAKAFVQPSPLSSCQTPQIWQDCNYFGNFYPCFIWLKQCQEFKTHLLRGWEGEKSVTAAIIRTSSFLLLFFRKAGLTPGKYSQRGTPTKWAQSEIAPGLLLA